MDVLEEKKIMNTGKGEIEIRLSDIVQFIKANIRKMLLGGAVGLILGAIYAYPKPNIFKVEVTVMPELQSRGSGGLGAVSAFTNLGIDNASTTDAIRPDLYPNVLQSVPFALSMLNQQVYSKKLGTKTTLQEFIVKTGTVSLLDKLFGLFSFRNNEDSEDRKDIKNTTQAIQLTKDQDGLVKAVQGSVSSAYDKKTGILTITATEIDPLVAAAVAQLSLNYLTNYITAYRTDKARNRVIFLKQQVQEVKQRYQGAEYALSNYRDRNRSLFLNTAKLDEQRLQADYLLEQSVYNDLARQLEQAKIKVQEETPTFKILQPAVVPLVKSGPKRTMITLGFAIAGIILVLAFVLARQLVFKKSNMKTALICGVSGQDGAYLAKLLLDKGYQVYGGSRDAQMASFNNLVRLGIREMVQFLSISINDFRSVLQTLLKVKPDEVYNLAGQSSVGLSFEQPVETLESISIGTLNLLEAIRFSNLPIKFYNAGSSECFGDTGSVAADEMTPFRPRSPYGVAKASAFWQVANYREAYQIHASTGILFNHESPLRPERFVTQKIVAAACRIAKGSDELLTLGNIDIARDWGWAPDYVEAMWLMLQKGKPDDYVIATGHTYKLSAFITTVFKTIGLDWKNYIHIDKSFFRPTDISEGHANPDKAKRQLGWVARYTMQDVARRMVEAQQIQYF